MFAGTGVACFLHQALRAVRSCRNDSSSNSSCKLQPDWKDQAPKQLEGSPALCLNLGALRRLNDKTNCRRSEIRRSLRPGGTLAPFTGLESIPEPADTMHVVVAGSSAKPKEDRRRASKIGRWH